MVKSMLKHKWSTTISEMNSLERELFNGRREVYKLAAGGKILEAKKRREMNTSLNRKLKLLRVNLWRYEEEYLS